MSLHHVAHGHWMTPWRTLKALFIANHLRHTRTLNILSTASSMHEWKLLETLMYRVFIFEYVVVAEDTYCLLSSRPDFYLTAAFRACSQDLYFFYQ